MVDISLVGTAQNRSHLVLTLTNGSILTSYVTLLWIKCKGQQSTDWHCLWPRNYCLVLIEIHDSQRFRTYKTWFSTDIHTHRKFTTVYKAQRSFHFQANTQDEQTKEANGDPLDWLNSRAKHSHRVPFNLIYTFPWGLVKVYKEDDAHHKGKKAMIVFIALLVLWQYIAQETCPLTFPNKKKSQSF